MEDTLVQIKLIIRSELTEDEIKVKIRAALETIPELRQIIKLELS